MGGGWHLFEHPLVDLEPEPLQQQSLQLGPLGRQEQTVSRRRQRRTSSLLTIWLMLARLSSSQACTRTV